jgi:hypothetical protein
MTKPLKLKACPNCGKTETLVHEFAIVICVNYRKGCGVSGPYSDPTGSKWNSLPRRRQTKGVKR